MIKITEFTQSPLSTMGNKAAYCYGMEDKPKRFRKIAERCLEEGHGRVTEFATIDLEISGYSAKVIRELYTHVIGTTRLQASTRYIDYSKQFGYVTPRTIEKDETAKEIWDNAMENIRYSMKALEELGVPVEDLTNLLPLAYETKMVLKINVRALIHMFHVRSCTCAYPEFRRLMADIKIAIYGLGDEEWEYLCDNYFQPKCIHLGYCEEEKRHCGIRPKKSDVFRMIDKMMSGDVVEG